MTSGQTITQKVLSPCIGLCSTTYGDMICRGCRRTSDEITNWHSMDYEQKMNIIDRLDKQITTVLSRYLVIEDAEKLRRQLQRLQINHDIHRSPWSWLLSLLVKRCDIIENTGQFGFRATSDLPLPKLTREAMHQMYQLSGG